MATKHILSIVLWMSVIAVLTTQANPTTTEATPVVPLPSPTPIQSLTCDFESATSPLCEWTNEDRGLSWVIKNGSQFPGHGDDSLRKEDGHILTTTGKPHIQGYALLASTQFPNGPHCVQLYLETRAQDSSTFVIYKRVKNLNAPVYTSRGKQFAHWEKLEVTIVSPQPYKIVLASHQTTGQIGQILVDDIQVTPGYCPLKPLSDINVTCDFEDVHRMCGFQSTPAAGHTTDIDHQQQWILSNQSLPLPRQMWPIKDHTLGTKNGHCLISQLYANATDQNTAIIRSPHYNGTGTHCLSFYYQMFAKLRNETDNIGNLRLYIVPEGKETEPSLLRGTWTEGDGRQWISVSVQFEMNTKYSVVFESQSSPHQTTYGIDDLTIRDYACPKPEPEPSSTTETTVAPTTTGHPETTETTKTTATTTERVKDTVTVVAGKQKEEKSNKSMIIGIVAGVSLLILIAIIVVFVTRNRRKNKGEKQPDYKRTESQDSMCRPPSSEFKSVAFTNPMTDAEYETHNNVCTIVRDLDEADA